MESTDILGYVVLILVLAAAAFAAVSMLRRRKKGGKDGKSGGGCAGCASRGSCPFSGKQTPPYSGGDSDGGCDSYAKKDREQKK